jgi:pimeloyl-ACP methyl ester carboxylesterase
VARSTQLPSPAPKVPRLRRAYYECRYGQLHIHNAIPPGGGFDELTTVVCLHGEGESGRVFLPLLAALGELRSVYALDLPGSGESDPAAGVTGAEAAVHAVLDFVDSMRIRSFDLVARGTGTTAALAILEQRGPSVRRALLLWPPDSVRSSGKITVVPADEAASTGLPRQVVTLLAP